MKDCNSYGSSHQQKRCYNSIKKKCTQVKKSLLNGAVQNMLLLASPYQN
jgi:hypothetical protein